MQCFDFHIYKSDEMKPETKIMNMPSYYMHKHLYRLVCGCIVSLWMIRGDNDKKN